MTDYFTAYKYLIWKKMSISIEFKNRINELIDDLLFEKELQKSDLPKEIGIDYNAFSKAINYAIVPKPLVLIRIADYFNVTIEYILGRTDDEYFCKANNRSNFQERMEILRESKKVSYYELTKELHIGKSYFSKWKVHNYLPSLELLILISEHFKTSIDYLLGRTDDRATIN